MKLNEIKTTKVDTHDTHDVHDVHDVHDAVTKAIKAALDRSAVVRSIDVDNEEILFSVGYDFPEHRNGKAQEVRAAFKGAGKVNAQKGGDKYDAGIDFQLTPKAAMTDEETEKLKAALKAEYKDAF
jgi:hypothetical protein